MLKGIHYSDTYNSLNDFDIVILIRICHRLLVCMTIKAITQYNIDNAMVFQSGINVIL